MQICRNWNCDFRSRGADTDTKTESEAGKSKSQKHPNERASKYAIMLFIFSHKNPK